MKKILWLTSWFPNLTDPLTGDFIERHALSASLYNDIYIIHVLKDYLQKTPGNLFINKKKHNAHCASLVIYYKTTFKKIKWLETIYSNYLFIRYFISALKSYIQKNGKPDCIHVHIALKAGVVALIAKWMYKIPYVVSEQWTGLCPEAKPNLDGKSFLFRWLWKLVMRNAADYSAVSRYLGDAIRSRFALKPFFVIPNVVNTDVFYPSPHSKDQFQFIHVSTLNYQKNPQQIFQAISVLRQKSNISFKVLVFGEPSDSLRQLATRLDIAKYVELKGTCPQKTLSQYMRQCNALILYSRFETFGCVIIEANACGLPVIVSDIPVLHENVQQGITGIFVPLDNPEALADQMLSVLKGDHQFDSDGIVELTRKKYDFSVVGKQWDELYDHTLRNK